MDHQYGMPDELLSGRPTNFQAIPVPQIPPQLFSCCHRDLRPPPRSHHHYHFDTMQTVGTQIGADQLMYCGLHQEFPSDSTANKVIATVTAAPSASCGFDCVATGRWPRQEALTLVEIRSRLHPMFKEANQKGPLWDEVSRIMYEEHGYRRSGETCKEKFENLFKYYQRTREVKAGRHDGKHHRGIEEERKKGNSARWKVKIEEFMDSQMKKLMERQEAWIEKLTKTLEQKEKERVSREEEWRKENAARLDREHKFWAKERAWIEAHGWQESEVSWLIQLRTCMESRFEEEEGCSEEILWEEIAAKMVSLGFERSALMCKHKWKSIGVCIMKTKEGNIKRKSTRCSDYNDYRNNESLYSQGEYCEMNDQQGPEAETMRLPANGGSSPSNSDAVNAVNDNCFLFFMADGDNMWETHGLKLSKSENQ
ncbi:Integrase-type DNA-binding superfamily protein [Hibiscus syriacus]|uniref:Integrase-type DNA-binding superfamily protein n=1 Tax=Hibiscus syriacus TaxID=106335 RepID=A0A6A2YML1_HIBSY|nr:Integrase-type DNA-binding superfamily protein [Hibiscus syriacus]